MTHTTGLRAVALVLASVALCAGCQGSVSVGDASPTVEQSDVEKTISTQLAPQLGTAPDSVDCPGDLKGKVGEVEKCTLTAGSDTVPVKVTVTSVDGTDVKFDIEAGNPGDTSSAG